MIWASTPSTLQEGWDRLIHQPVVHGKPLLVPQFVFWHYPASRLLVDRVSLAENFEIRVLCINYWKRVCSCLKFTFESKVFTKYVS